MKYVMLVLLVTGIIGGVVGWSKFSKPLVLGYDINVEDVSTNNSELKINKSDDVDGLISSIKSVLSQCNGSYGLYVYRLDEQTGYGINENESMVAGSMMKVPILLAAERAISRGELQIDQIYLLKNSDKRSGSGPLEYYDAGTKLSTNTLMKEMGKKSDNTAPVILVDLLGKDNILKEMGNLKMTKSSFDDNTSTAFDMARMWSEVYKGDGFNEEQRKRIYENLSESIYEDRISAGIPAGVEIIHKVGTGDGLWGDGGIVMATRPFVLVILNKDIKLSEAEEIVPKVVKMVWNFETGR